MFKKMLSRFLILSLLISTSGFAQVHNSSLIEILQKYDYQLTARDAVTDENARLQLIEKMRTEIALAASEMSQDEVKVQIREILNQIPNQENREALEFQLQFATLEELENMLVDPKLISSSLHGEGSNFTFDNGGAATLGVVLVVSAVIVLALKVYCDSEEVEYEIEYDDDESEIRIERRKRRCM